MIGHFQDPWHGYGQQAGELELPFRGGPAAFPQDHPTPTFMLSGVRQVLGKAVEERVDLVDDEINFVQPLGRHTHEERPVQGQRNHLWIDSEAVELLVDSVQTLCVVRVRLIFFGAEEQARWQKTAKSIRHDAVHVFDAPTHFIDGTAAFGLVPFGTGVDDERLHVDVVVEQPKAAFHQFVRIARFLHFTARPGTAFDTHTVETVQLVDARAVVPARIAGTFVNLGTVTISVAGESGPTTACEVTDCVETERVGSARL